MVKAIRYLVKVSDSVLDYVHGAAYSIEEVFIPDERICFNIHDGQLSVFKTNKARGDSNTEAREILLERGFVGDLEKILSLREKCFKKIKKILK